MISLQFLGAAGTVTGSKYALTVGDSKLLIDCGLFQGEKELRARNWEPFPRPPQEFQKMLLTHAHVDHSGYIPCLYRQGFRGKILTTRASQQLCEILLPDSARLQEEEAAYLARHGLSRHHPPQPLYSEQDAQDSLRLFEAVELGQKIKVLPGITATFHEAGHILGSAWLELELARNGGGKPLKLVMSGDLGREGAPIVRDPSPPVACDYMVLESTYGDRQHNPEPVGPRLAAIIQDTVKRKGILVIPAFAVERSQELLYLMESLHAAGEIARVPVFLDSPMATQATRVFEKHRQLYDEEASDRALLKGGLLNYKKLKFCETISDSKAIQRAQPPFVVIAASGMATGGRVLHHLLRYLPDPNNTVLLVGFQAVGSRGWRLLKGEPTLKLLGEEVPVRAQVKVLDGFSGHADYVQINQWLQRLPQAPRRVFLVHGEPAALQAQQQRIAEWPGWQAYVPRYQEIVVLD